MKPHTDAGRDYLPGQVIELAEDQARWLRQIGVAKAAPAKAQPDNVADNVAL